MKHPSIKRLQIRYSGRFIALWRGKVIASARTNGGLLKKIHSALLTKQIELMFVPPKGMTCVY